MCSSVLVLERGFFPNRELSFRASPEALSYLQQGIQVFAAARLPMLVYSGLIAAATLRWAVPPIVR